MYKQKIDIIVWLKVVNLYVTIRLTYFDMINFKTGFDILSNFQIIYQWVVANKAKN